MHGYLIIDKPLGMTSSQVVGKIRRLYNIKKVGHGGTLDPLATGVLPIALGEATKTLSAILDGTKSYLFEVKWGEARSTEDCEGEVTARSDVLPSREDIEKAILSFLGTISQMPPIYSALKVNGKRAYALAREGKDVQLQPRQVEIKNLKLRESSSHTAKFEVTCSKGTYVRSLARDIALNLGTYGHLISLRRLSAGPFHERDAILLDSLLNIGHKTELVKYVLPLQEALVDILALEIQATDAEKLRQGQTIACSSNRGGDVVLALCNGVPQALTKVKAGRMSPIRVFNI